MKAVALCLFFVLTSATARAADCLDKTRVENEIYQTFTVQTGTKGEDPEKRVDLCDPKNLGYLLFKSLLFLKDLGTTQARQDQFSANILEQQPFEFFKKRVKVLQIDFGADEFDCVGMAYVHTAEKERRILHFCPLAAVGQQSVVTLSSALVHEARHLDGNNYPHAMCVSGDLSGKSSCDDSYAEGGSYAVSTEYEVNLSESANVDPAIRATARALAVNDLLVRFNQLPLDLREGAVLSDDNGRLSFFDGQNLEATGLSVDPTGVLFARGMIATVFEPASGQVESYTFGSGLTPALDGVLNRRYVKMSPSERSDIIDLLYGKNYVCFLREQSIECSGHDEVFFKKTFSSFRARRFIFESVRSSFFPAGQAHVVSSDRRLYLLPDELEDLSTTDPNQWPIMNGGFKALAVQPWPSGEILLNDDGSIQTFSRRDKKWSSPPALAAKKFTRLAAPFVWSKKLTEL